MIEDDNDSLQTAENNIPLKRKTLADIDDSPYFWNLNSDKVKDFINYSVERYQQLPHHRSDYPEAGMEAATFGIAVLIVALACSIADREGHSIQDEMINRFKEQVNEKITEFHIKRLEWKQQDELGKREALQQRQEQDWQMFNEELLGDFLQFFGEVSNSDTQEYELNEFLYNKKGTSVRTKNVGTNDVDITKTLYERILNYPWNEKVGLTHENKEENSTSETILSYLLAGVSTDKKTREKVEELFDTIEIYLYNKPQEKIEEMKSQGKRAKDINRESNLSFTLASKETKEVPVRNGSSRFPQNTFVWNKHVVLKDNDNEKLSEIPEQSITQKIEHSRPGSSSTEDRLFSPSDLPDFSEKKVVELQPEDDSNMIKDVMQLNIMDNEFQRLGKKQHLTAKEENELDKLPKVIAKIENHIDLAQQSSSFANSRYGSFSQTASSSDALVSTPHTNENTSTPPSPRSPR